MGVVAGMRRWAPEAYFFLYNAAIVFIIPFFAILWRSEGFTGGQIGILAAVRPFICSVSGQLLVGLADARRWHFRITIITYVLTMAARGAMGLTHGFVGHLLLIIVAESCQSPFSIMSDAAIAASTDEAGYGRKRVLSSLGYGALAPLSGWIVGRTSVQLSIAIYFAIVTVALVPTLLLPLKELGRRRTSAAQEAEADAKPAKSPKSASAGALATHNRLARGSTIPLLLAAGSGNDSGGLDSRQHGCHAAELAIELVGPEPAAALASGKEVAAAAAETDSQDLAARIASKINQAEGQTPTAAGVTLRPLLTTADEDAAEEAAATARATAAEAAAAADDDDRWSIPAVGSPLTARCAGLPPNACPPAGAGTPLSPSCPPLPPGNASIPIPVPGRPIAAGGGAYATPPASFGPTPRGMMGLARTTSAATTAYYSMRSVSSVNNLNNLNSNVVDALAATPSNSGLELGPTFLPRTAALLRQLSEAASHAGSTVLYTPRTTASAAAAAPVGPLDVAARVTPLVLAQQPLQQPAGLLHQSSLAHQYSNMSQALNGFDPAILEGSVSDGTFMTPRGAVSPRSGSFAPAQAGTVSPPAPLPQGLLRLPSIHTVHPPHFLDGGSSGYSSCGGASQHSRRMSDASTGGGTGSTHSRQLRRRNSNRWVPTPPGGMETAKSPLLSTLVEPAPTAEMSIALMGGVKEPLLLSSISSLDGPLSHGQVAIQLPISSINSAGAYDASAHGAGVYFAADPVKAAATALPLARQDVSVWAGVRLMLSNPHHAAFFATALLMGIGFGVLGYVNLYVKESGGPGLLLGIMVLVSTSGEIPLFATSGWWLPKLGHTLAFNIGMAGWILRLSLYTLIPMFPSLWCIVPVELLQGLCFAVSYGVGTVHVKAISPPHLRSTTQSIFFSLYYGIGPGISGLAGGFIYDAMGMRFVFIIGATVLLVGWLIILLALRWATRGERAARAAAAAAQVTL